MRILIDMDEIAADLLAEWLKRYNAQWEDNLLRANVTDWDIHKFVRPECGKKVYGILHEPDLFADLDPFPGVVEAVTSFVESGYDVRFCTAAPSQSSMTPKANWVKRHFGHLDFGMSNIITMADKVWLAPSVDVLVDDKPRTVKEWRAYADNHHTGEHSPRILAISHPYNQMVRDEAHLFAEDYLNTEQAWSQIAEYIHDLAWDRRGNKRPVLAADDH